MATQPANDRSGIWAQAAWLYPVPAVWLDGTLLSFWYCPAYHFMVCTSISNLIKLMPMGIDRIRGGRNSIVAKQKWPAAKYHLRIEHKGKLNKFPKWFKIPPQSPEVLRGKDLYGTFVSGVRGCFQNQPQWVCLQPLLLGPQSLPDHRWSLSSPFASNLISDLSRSQKGRNWEGNRRRGVDVAGSRPKGLGFVLLLCFPTATNKTWV